MSAWKLSLGIAGGILIPIVVVIAGLIGHHYLIYRPALERNIKRMEAETRKMEAEIKETERKTAELNAEYDRIRNR